MESDIPILLASAVISVRDKLTGTVKITKESQRTVVNFVLKGVRTLIRIADCYRVEAETERLYAKHVIFASKSLPLKFRLESKNQELLTEQEEEPVSGTLYPLINRSLSAKIIRLYTSSKSVAQSAVTFVSRYIERIINEVLVEALHQTPHDSDSVNVEEAIEVRSETYF